MRGMDGGSGSLFSYVDLESRVRSDHPLRTIREIANAALEAMTEDFAALYPLGLVGHRSRLSVCCGRCCCRHFMESDRNGS